MTFLTVRESKDKLVRAKCTTTRGAEYENCLLYVAQLQESGLSISADQDWQEGSFVYLQLPDGGAESWEDLFITCKVKKKSRALGRLWFYELSFFRTPEVKRNQAFELLSKYRAPEGRRHYRHACMNPFEITVRLEKTTQPVEDISCSGLCFISLAKYTLGQEIESKVFFENFAFMARLRVDRMEERANGFAEYGCTFLGLTEEDGEKLVNYIYRRARTQLAS